MFYRPHTSTLLALAMSSTLSVCAFAAPGGASFTVSTGDTNTSAQSLGSGHIGTVESNGRLSVSGSNVAVTINASSTVNNNGTIEQTGSARSIYDNTAGAVLTLNNNGTITAIGDDVIKIGKGTAGIILNNQGTIWQKGTNPGTGQALDLTSITSTGSSIINGSVSNSTALIQADGDDALRPGSNMSILNYGTIISKGTVNTKMTGTLASGATEAKAQDGIDVQDRTGVSVDNYGLISGPRHGITADNSVTVTNRSGGIIIGNNGSGVGSDGTGTVTNYGTITGAYAGAGKAYDHSATNGGVSTANNGDGDGVDVDGIATITNYGTIQGLGAGGVDSGGNPNGADGIAAGGGTIINHAGATIYGQSKGILIDDGANGTTATIRGTADAAGAEAIITNDGSITGDKKTAIGLVGNYNDTITNNVSGIITGGKDSVRVDALASTTAASAIQMGGGNDILTNYGVIEGKNGLAVDMGDGDDTLHLLGGSVIGSITGGNGNDTLILGGKQTYSTRSAITSFESLTTTGNGVTVESRIGGKNPDKLTFIDATLSNGTSIKPIPKGLLANNSVHTILTTSNSLTTDPAQLSIIDTSAMFDYSLEKSGNDLNIIVHTKDIRALTDTKLSSLTTALQNLGNSDNASLIMEHLASCSTDQQLSNAIKQLTPDISNAALQAAINAQGSVFGAIGSRMGSSGGALASAQNGMNAGDDITSRGWVQLLGNTAKQDARKGADGYSIDAAGFAIGYERDTSTNALFGVTAGYTGAKSYGEDSSSGDTTEIDSFHAGIYYSIDAPSFSLDTTLVGSYNTYNGSRQSMLGTALSNYDGFSFGALIEGGIPINISNNWSIKPLLGGQYSYNTISGYEESGTADALHLDNTDSSSLRSIVGAKFTHTLNTHSNYTLGIKYLHEFASAPSTTAGFIGTGSTFTVDGVEPPREALQLGIDYQILTTEGKTLSAGYHAEIKDQYLSHQLALKMVF